MRKPTLIARRGNVIELTNGSKWRIVEIKADGVYGEPVNIKGNGRRLQPSQLREAGVVVRP